MTNNEKALKMHEEWNGKIRDNRKVRMSTQEKILPSLILRVLQNLVR